MSLFASQPIMYRYDTASKIALQHRVKGSHLKVYMPSLPYFNIISIINGALVKLSEKEGGWEYYLATSHKKIDDLTYDFFLRKDVKFQDGTPFNADSVVENVKNFLKGPFLYSDIHNALKSAQKIDDYTVRIHLYKPYGMLLNDLSVINFYTKEYYKKYNYRPSLTAQNTKGAGKYGIGAYELVSGYASGLTQSDVIVLKANPFYFEKGKPYIETITIYTKMPIQEVIEKITKKEGELDIAFIPYDKKTEIVNSKYAKLITTQSNSNLTVHFNLMKKSSKLKDKKVRQALNDALNQKNLIKFVFKGEAKKSPFLLSSNAYYAKEISQKYLHRRKRFSQNELYEILNGLHLKVITQDRFLSVFKGVEYELKKYGVELSYDITSNEKYVLTRLLKNRENRYDWDLLMWGNDDWNGHPWTGLFTLYTGANWSAVDEDKYLYDEYQKLFKLDTNDARFQKKVNELLLYSYDMAYTLVLPTPNIVIALNKEVVFKPSKMATFPIWNAKITPYHWSIRKNKELPHHHFDFLYPTKYEDE